MSKNNVAYNVVLVKKNVAYKEECNINVNICQHSVVMKNVGILKTI